MNFLLNYLYQFVLISIIALKLFNSMPYNVPLQGIVGGKRTLVLLDDLVSFNQQYIMNSLEFHCFYLSYRIL